MFNRFVTWVLPAVPKIIVHKVARRYIAGDALDDALATLESLSHKGFGTTVDILGEDTVELGQARVAASQYVELIEALAERGLERNVSLKLTQLGIRIDESRAFDELKRILDAAAQNDTFVRIDMEDATLTDKTFEFYRRAREIWPRVGTVVQSRLRRTVDDVAQLASEGADLRLCKGIYKESRENAYQGREEIRESFLESARLLMDAPRARVGLATHDLPLVERLRWEIEKRPGARDRLEFQALLGVPIRSGLERLREEGFEVRLYVPYGPEWYAYSVRRLKENPDMAGAIAKSLFKRDRL